MILSLALSLVAAEIPLNRIDEWISRQSTHSPITSKLSIPFLKALLIHNIDRSELFENKELKSLRSIIPSTGDTECQKIINDVTHHIDTVISSGQVYRFYYQILHPTPVVATLAWSESDQRDLDIRILQSGKVVHPWGISSKGVLSRRKKSAKLSVERIDTEVDVGEEFTVQVRINDTASAPCSFTLLVTGGELSDRHERRVQNLHSTIKSEKEARLRVEKYAKVNGIAIDTLFENGAQRTIIDIVDGKPSYYETCNLVAAKSSQTDQVWPDGGLGFSLSGATLPRSIGIWDAGAVYKEHQEFGDRVTLGENVSVSDHATLVAATMIATGVALDAKGMAYEANLKSYDWTGDQSGMRLEAANGLAISQHSYSHYNNYLYRPDWDAIANDFPFYTISKSAGNNGELGYSTINTYGNSKNIITVGSAADQPEGWSSSSISVSSFSSRGPTPDFRIKPDIVANGEMVFTASATKSDSYTYASGTSISGPVLAGSSALLHELYFNTHGNTLMRSATMRGLIIHTADEVGDEGPDYTSGWGYLNTAKAAELINGNEGGAKKVIQELSLSSNKMYILHTVPESGKDITVTICWNDPVNSNSEAKKELVNDLDLRVILDGKEYLPWAMDTMSYTAQKADNCRDNVEKVVIPNASGASAEIVITHKGVLTEAQNFSLFISGATVEERTKPNIELFSPNGGELWKLNTSHDIRWFSYLDEPVDILLYKGNELIDTVTKAIPNSGIFNWRIADTLEVGDDYRVVVASITDELIRDTGNATFSIQPEDLVVNFPYSENFDSFSIGTELSSLWEQETSDDIEWFVHTDKTPSKAEGDGTGADSDHTTGTGNYLYIEASYNYGKKGVVKTPFLSLSNLIRPKLAFWLHMFSEDGKMGTLAIHAVVDGVMHENIYSRSGNYGDLWVEQILDLSPYKGKRVQLLFEGIVGNGSTTDSDICIDDITVYEGTVTQTISLDAGWNTISFNVIPDDPAVTTIFGNLNYLTVVQNNNGKIFAPEFNQNDIGTISISEGYRVYVRQPEKIVISGVPASAHIPLKKGWNILPYYPRYSMGIDTALTTIISKVKLVVNNSAQVYQPEYQQNDIGSMHPGNGYLIYMTDSTTLIF